MTGIDLTPEYVETGQTLCSWVGLSDRIRLEIGDATGLSYPDGTFDRAYMMHVGMNIHDKQTLMAQLHRVLRPGAKLGVYDVLRVGDGELQFPVPWAMTRKGSAVATQHEYEVALQEAGFRVVAERNRVDFALEFFAQVKAKTAGADGPPPLGLHILMGDTALTKLKNMVENISRGLIAPIELVAEKEGKEPS